MGELSTTLLHNLTDRMAARFKADFDGVVAELASAANKSLAATLYAGTADPAVHAALMGYCNSVDRGARQAYYSTVLTALLSQARYGDLAQAIANYVVSADGGANDSFADYLNADATRLIHPLAAEIFRAVGGLGETGFTLSSTSDVVGCFSPGYQAQYPKRVYTGADGALVDDTTDATDADLADVALFVANGDGLYVGFDHPFTGIIVALSTLAGATITPTFQYWDGSAWSALTVTDNTVGFTLNRLLSWTAPDNWSPAHQDAGGTDFADKTPRYYIKITRGAAVLAQPPVGSLITVVPEAVVNDSLKHIGVTQPPLAIIEITAADTMDITQIVEVDYSRFVEPVPRFRALTPIGSDVTITLPYVDQDGNDASNAQALWAAPALLAVVAATLGGGDTGVQSIRESGGSIITVATGGVIAVEVTEARTPAI